jgi:hypothetical protein
MSPTGFAATQATGPACFHPVLEPAVIKNRASLATTLVVCVSLVAAVALTACGGGSSSNAAGGAGGAGGKVTPPAGVSGVKLPAQVSAVTAN